MNVEITHGWPQNEPPPDYVMVKTDVLMDVWADGFVSGFATALANHGMPLELANDLAQTLVRRMNADPVMRDQIIETVRGRLQGEISDELQPAAWASGVPIPDNVVPFRKDNDDD